MNRPKHEIKLRPAGIKDLELLKYWDSKQHVIDCDPDDDWNWELELKRDPEWREQLVAEKDGRPIGFIQIIDPLLEETQYWQTEARNTRAIDIWIGEESDLGKGMGTEMMKLALIRCFEDPNVTAVYVDPLKSNTKAHRFYQKLGFQFVEERNLD